MTGGVVADVLLDACCLINLCASGRLPDILGGLPDAWHVCTAVAGETLFVDEIVSGRVSRSEVDLQPWFDRGLLRRCKLSTTDEISAFVQYAARLDDGEAMCLALGKCRSWTVGTDERKGRRIAAEDGIAIVSTVEIVKSWAEVTSALADVVAEVVSKIGVLGRYRPRPNSPGVEWWREQGGSVAG